MATTPINTVPLGRAGTGSAFLLGESQAANQLLNTLQYNQQVQQQEAMLREQQAQQLAANWQKNQLKVDGGLYWQPEFNKRYQDHLQKGIQLRQMGVDPFNYNPSDPLQAEAAQDYLLERQGILSDTADRKLREAELKKSFDMVRKDPSNYYSSDISALNKIVETPYAEARGMQIPNLTQRFDPNTLLKTITPAQVGSELVVGNKKIKSVKALPEETRAAIVSSYTNSPDTARWVDELTGRQGFTIPMLEAIPNTRDAVKARIEAQYNGNPELRTQLATQGVTPGSDAYKKFVNQETERLYDAKSRWNKQIDKDLTQVLPKVKEMSSVLPDYSAEDQAMQRRRLQLAEQANARAAANATGTDDDVLFRQRWVEDMLDEVPDSGERLKAIVAGNPDYDGELKLDIRGNKIVFDVPSKKTSYVNEKGETKMKTIPGGEVTIDRSEKGVRSKLNKLVSELTGEEIKESKFATGQPSGKIKGEVVSSAAAPKYRTTVKRSEIGAKAKAAGYSIAEYEKLLKQAGVKIQ